MNLENISTPQSKNFVFDDFDYSNEKKKSNKLDFTKNPKEDSKKIQISNFNFISQPDEIKIINLSFSERKIKYETKKKLYRVDEEIAPIKKTLFNEYFKFLFRYFFKKDELLKLMRYLSSLEDYDFSSHIEIRKIHKNSKKEDISVLCRKLLNMVVKNKY